MPEETDVVIAGAGPAGAAAAIVLRSHGRSVHLVDLAGRPGSVRRPAFGETLIPGALALLDVLGVREAFLAGQPSPCQSHWSAWGGPDALERATIVDPHGPGWFIDRPHFDGLLRSRALQLGAHGTSPGRLSIVGRDRDARRGAGPPGLWDLHVAGDGAPRGHRARFLLDATGRTAHLARALGAERQRADNLAAVAMEFDGVASEPAATWVETCELGWWYASSGARGRPCVVLMTDADLLRTRGADELDNFRALFADTRASQRFELGAPSPHSQAPIVCSAATACTLPAVGEGWVATGDAAVSLDPLSSRGISAALLSGIHAAHAIDAHLNGDTDALQSYAATLRRVYGDHRRTQRAYYRMERRFAGAPFWQRRGADSAV